MNFKKSVWVPTLVVGSFIPVQAVFAQHPDIGLNQLEAEVGAATVSGAGVRFLHVEAETDERESYPNTNTPGPYYLPAINSQTSSKTFTDATGGSQGFNNHATSVAVELYGSTAGVANGLGETGSPAITMRGASEWVSNEVQINFDGDLTPNGVPRLSNFDVSNHSYVFRTTGGLTAAQAADAANRIDYVVNETNMTTVVGTDNQNSNGNQPVPFGHAQAYNVISVGRRDGRHAAGSTTLNAPGRISVDIVSPKRAAVGRESTSGATAIVSGSAAILHQTGAGTDATKSEVIKATLLAGATKEEFISEWDRTTVRPLDEVYGAGEVNIYNSYFIQQGGEIDGSTSQPASSAGLNGWDYEDSIATGDQRFYQFTVPSGQKLNDFSIVLTWNLNVQDSTFSRFTFIPSTSLADLSLELYDSTTGFLVSMIDASDSPVDNVEHIYISNLSAGTYHLKVSNKATDSFNTDYGLAFRSSAILLGDVNQSGDVDFLDIVPFILLLTSGDYQVEADVNCDGEINFMDIAGYIAAISR